MNARNRLMELLKREVAELEKLKAELRTAKARHSAFQSSVEAAHGDESAASAKRKLEDKVRKEQSAITDCEQKITDSESRTAAFEEAIKLLPKENGEPELRAGSTMSRVRDFIRAANKPLALAEIMKGLSIEDTKEQRNSLRGSLSGYARDGRVFTKEIDQPDTFGLLEFRRMERKPENDNQDEKSI